MASVFGEKWTARPIGRARSCGCLSALAHSASPGRPRSPRCIHSYGGMIDFFRFTGDSLRRNARLQGFAPGYARWRSIDQTAAGDFNGNGRPEVLALDASLRGVGLRPNAPGWVCKTSLGAWMPVKRSSATLRRSSCWMAAWRWRWARPTDACAFGCRADSLGQHNAKGPVQIHNISTDFRPRWPGKAASTRRVFNHAGTTSNKKSVVGAIQ